MSQISAKLVGALRDSTGAGMMSCKKALEATNGDIEAAKEWLRKQGLSSASKKQDRATSDGIIAIASNDKNAVLIELNSETDFVAKNEKFIALAEKIANFVLQNNIFDVQKVAEEKSIADAIIDHIAILGENIRLKRIENIAANTVVQYYIHNAVPGSKTCGKLCVLVAIDSDVNISKESKERIRIIAKQIAMHIAATKPEALSVNELNKELVDKEKEILTEQARKLGEPEGVIEKMIEDHMKKFYEEVVLLEQCFILNPEQKIGELIANLEKEIDATVKITKYLRCALGENSK